MQSQGAVICYPVFSAYVNFVAITGFTYYHCQL